jgi:hypothetical protein
VIYWRHKRTARMMMMSRTANPRQAELQMAKEILAEIFRVRPGEVEEMIRRRLDEENRTGEQKDLPHQWPVTFGLGE